MIKNIADLAKVAGIDADALKAAIESEESVEIQIKPEDKSFNPSKYQEDENFNLWRKNYGDEKFIAGRETMIKETRNELGLEFEGKTMENLLNSFKGKVIKDASIEPEKRVGELESDLNNLRLQLKEKEETVNKINSDLLNTRFQYTVQDKLRSTLMGINAETVIPESDILDLYKNKRKIQQGDNNNLLLINPETNEPLKDELRNPVKLEDDFKTFAMNYIKKPEGGRGISNEPESKKGSLDAFDKRMQSDGIAVSSMEYNKKMQEAILSGELEID